jgi:hypothetical protein
LEQKMKVGTRSVLFGYHCFPLHGWFVLWGWFSLHRFRRVHIGDEKLMGIYRRPLKVSILSPKLWLSAFVHDIGYWGKPNMDGPEGETHPEVGAAFMREHYGNAWGDFCLYHSRFYAKRDGAQPSALCMADKVAFLKYPDWLIIALVRLSGEGKEYMANHSRDNADPVGARPRHLVPQRQGPRRRVGGQAQGRHHRYRNPNPGAPVMIQATRKIELLQRMWHTVQNAMNGQVPDGFLEDYQELLVILSGDPNNNTSVLQNWLVGIPIRMQSTLVLGLRGPDGMSTQYIKQWTRWLRGLVFKPGNPDNVKQFMLMDLPPMLEDKSPLAYELYIMPQHYYSHLMHSIQVVAMRHPDPEVAAYALQMYVAMAETLHLMAEDHATFEARLCHREWPGGGQPDTGAEAVALLDG